VALHPQARRRGGSALRQVCVCVCQLGCHLLGALTLLRATLTCRGRTQMSTSSSCATPSAPQWTASTSRCARMCVCACMRVCACLHVCVCTPYDGGRVSMCLLQALRQGGATFPIRSSEVTQAYPSHRHRPHPAPGRDRLSPSTLPSPTSTWLLPATRACMCGSSAPASPKQCPRVRARVGLAADAA